MRSVGCFEGQSGMKAASGRAVGGTVRRRRAEGGGGVCEACARQREGGRSNKKMAVGEVVMKSNA